MHNVDITAPPNPRTTGKVAVKMYRAIRAAKRLTIDIYDYASYTTERVYM